MTDSSGDMGSNGQPSGHPLSSSGRDRGLERLPSGREPSPLSLVERGQGAGQWGQADSSLAVESSQNSPRFLSTADLCLGCSIFLELFAPPD